MKTFISLRGDENAESEIKLHDAYNEAYDMLQADLLQDWIAELTDMYEAKMNEILPGRTGRKYE